MLSIFSRRKEQGAIDGRIGGIIVDGSVREEELDVEGFSCQSEGEFINEVRSLFRSNEVMSVLCDSNMFVMVSDFGRGAEGGLLGDRLVALFRDIHFLRLELLNSV